MPAKHNPKLKTGDVEVLAEELDVLNRCPTPKFEVMSIPTDDQSFADAELANEDLRLEYRYLDLRRPTLQRTLALRHRVNKVIRDYFDAQRLPGTGDADAGPQLAGGRPRLPGAQPGQSRQKRAGRTGTPCRNRRSCTSSC